LGVQDVGVLVGDIVSQAGFSGFKIGGSLLVGSGEEVDFISQLVQKGFNDVQDVS
jgi:hypothetical protein